MAAVSVEMNAVKCSLESIMTQYFREDFEEVYRSKFVVSAFEIMRFFSKGKSSVLVGYDDTKIIPAQ